MAAFAPSTPNVLDSCLREKASNSLSYSNVRKSHLVCMPRLQNKTKVSFTRAAILDQEVKLAKDDLLFEISKSERGLKKDVRTKDKVLKVIEALAKAGEGTTTTDDSLTATWRLLWTTEKETLFIFEKASLFGTSAGDTWQPIDVKKQTLGNIITFPPSGAFQVDASIEIVSLQRVNFKFLSAKLRTATREFSLPPFGQGWFENVYMDEEIRISRDSRGDTLVTERAQFSL